YYLGGIEATRTTGGVWSQVRRTYPYGGVTVASRTTTTSGTGVSWLLGDRQGSITTTITAGTASTRWYLPYGGRRGPAPGTVPTTTGFLGKHEDGSGLTHLEHRDYDPTTGVFITVDPLVATTGDPYSYAAGNPTTLSDPNGLDPGWAQDQDPCNDAGYYTCGTVEHGGKRGKHTPVGPGERQCQEAPWSSGCTIAISGSDGSTIEIAISEGVSDDVRETLTGPDSLSVGTVGACGNVFGGFGFFGQGELCAVGDFEDLALQATAEAAAGAGMTFSAGGGALISNADDSDSLLGWSACMGASGGFGGGVSGELCFGLTSDLAGAEPTGVWTFYLGGSFGGGAEGHVGLARTVEIAKAEDALCHAIAGPIGGLLFC
ncbi:MAG: hypothetical protein RL238_2157, partial [Actinomycetota bacterium]